MRKIILMVALMVMSGSAMAEWIDTDSYGEDAQLYFDPSSVTKKGYMVTVWTLFDNKAEKFSQKIHMQFDCKNAKRRKLATYGYTGNMLTGTIDERYLKPDSWETANNYSDRVFDEVCDSTAAGPWIKFGSDEETVIYVGMADSKGKAIARLQYLIDFKSEDRSAKFRSQFDCVNVKEQILSAYVYAGHMGVGKVTESEPQPGEWKSTNADRAIYKYACGIK